ncbi:MAG TPA: AAA family ATPase, partial [Ktedonosporobacter sp.]|nr:AAA family ATPase [Ktedonosporobacter sp.]
MARVHYRQQYTACGKPNCRPCLDGVGHGPYWYKYEYDGVRGYSRRTYIGKHLPEGVSLSELPAPFQKSTSLLRIYTLGPLRLEVRTGPEGTFQPVPNAAWREKRPRQVLVTLLSNVGRRIGREQLLECLWPDVDLEIASGRLDRAAYSLRHLFESESHPKDSSPLFVNRGETVYLAEYPAVWIDADAFEYLAGQAFACPDQGEKEQIIEKAVALYRGTFLAGERGEAIIVRRQQLHRLYVGLLIELADLRIARNAIAAAIELLSRLHALDPANEAAAQRLIRLLAQTERRSEAVAVYKQLTLALQQECRAKPTPATSLLYENVRSGIQKAHTRVPQLVSSQPENAPVPGAKVGPDSLVGREQEMQQILELLQGAEQVSSLRLPSQKHVVMQGPVHCALLLGEAGIGKTRLAKEASQMATLRGWTVAWSRIYEQESIVAYQAWTKVLRTALSDGRWQRGQITKRPLVFQPLTMLLPDLFDFLPTVTYPPALPDQERLRLWDAIRELLIILSEKAPLLIVLDDLQWADSSSCELLGYLACRLYGLPLVLIVTCRQQELDKLHPLHPLLANLQRENAVAILQLPPLSNDQMRSLLTPLPPSLIQQICQRSAGNPFFAQELARAAIEHTSQDEKMIPDTIAATLDARLLRLSTSCQHLLQKASVLGSAFSFQAISAIQTHTDESTEESVLDGLEEALSAGMLAEEGEGMNTTYHFWHPLLCSHLYKQLSAARRARLHRRAGKWFCGFYQGREEEGAAPIVYHLVGGGASQEQVAYYALFAANHAYQLCSYPEASRFYRLILDPSQVDLSPLSQQQKVRILELLGECLANQGKREEALHCYQAAIQISQRCDLQPEHLALLWCELGMVYYNGGQTDLARRCSEKAEQILQPSPLTQVFMYIRFQQGLIFSREGHYEKAHQVTREALDLLDTLVQVPAPDGVLTRSERVRAGTYITHALLYKVLALCECACGEDRKAQLHLEKALSLFEQSHDERQASMAYCNLGDLFMRQADYTQAQMLTHRALSIAERMGETPFVAFLHGNLAQIQGRYGHLRE